MVKALDLLKQLKGFDFDEIQKRAAFQEEIAIKTLEIVNQMQKNQRLIVQKLGLKYIEIEIKEEVENNGSNTSS